MECPLCARHCTAHGTCLPFQSLSSPFEFGILISIFEMKQIMLKAFKSLAMAYLPQRQFRSIWPHLRNGFIVSWILPLLWNSLALPEFISRGLWTPIWVWATHSRLPVSFSPSLYLLLLSSTPPRTRTHTQLKLQSCSLYSKLCLLFKLTY